MRVLRFAHLELVQTVRDLAIKSLILRCLIARKIGISAYE